MDYEIDHIFILVSKGAPEEAQLLIDFGLTEGPNRIHKGQGTTNRCFFFNNVMLELLWVHDEDEAQNDSTTPTTLWPRWQGRKDGTSTFGLCLRPKNNPLEQPPFAAWKYQPELLFPKGMYVYIANSIINLAEPFVFYGPTGKRQDSYIDESIRQHKIGFKELTSISLSNRQEVSSDAFNALLEHNVIAINSNLNNKIELQFDGVNSGNKKDFSPELPLIIKW